MKYFYDTEFVDDGRTIDLISIGIVAEDGREYYAQNVAYDPLKASANQWLTDNVISQLLQCPDYPNQTKINHWNGYEGVPDVGQNVCAHRHPTCPWKTPVRIREDIRAFCDREQYGKPEFWAYFSAYDHVVLAQLFGPMINFPKGWPMYTNDLKQFAFMVGDPQLPAQASGQHHALADARHNRDVYKWLWGHGQVPNRFGLDQSR